MTSERETVDSVRRLYARRAPTYDLLSLANAPVRRRAITKLDLRPGDVVLDVGCGTGLSLAPMERAIGPTGTVVGVDLSPDMLARAHSRVRSRGWTNVVLIEAAAEDVELPHKPTAVLFSWVPSVLSSENALQNLFAQVSAGARVVAIAEKEPPRWSLPAWVRAAITGSLFPRYPDYWQPGGLLSEFLSDLRMESANFGATYIAHGILAATSR